MIITKVSVEAVGGVTATKRNWKAPNCVGYFATWRPAGDDPETSDELWAAGVSCRLVRLDKLPNPVPALGSDPTISAIGGLAMPDEPEDPRPQSRFQKCGIPGEAAPSLPDLIPSDYEWLREVDIPRPWLGTKLDFVPRAKQAQRPLPQVTAYFGDPRPRRPTIDHQPIVGQYAEATAPSANPPIFRLEWRRRHSPRWGAAEVAAHAIREGLWRHPIKLPVGLAARISEADEIQRFRAESENCEDYRRSIGEAPDVSHDAFLVAEPVPLQDEEYAPIEAEQATDDPDGGAIPGDEGTRNDDGRNDHGDPLPAHDSHDLQEPRRGERRSQKPSEWHFGRYTNFDQIPGTPCVRILGLDEEGFPTLPALGPRILTRPVDGGFEPMLVRTPVQVWLPPKAHSVAGDHGFELLTPRDPPWPQFQAKDIAGGQRFPVWERQSKRVLRDIKAVRAEIWPPAVERCIEIVLRGWKTVAVIRRDILGEYAELKIIGGKTVEVEAKKGAHHRLKARGRAEDAKWKANPAARRPRVPDHHARFQAECAQALCVAAAGIRRNMTNGACGAREYAILDRLIFSPEMVQVWRELTKRNLKTSRLFYDLMPPFHWSRDDLTAVERCRLALCSLLSEACWDATYNLNVTTYETRRTQYLKANKDNVEYLARMDKEVPKTSNYYITRNTGDGPARALSISMMEHLHEITGSACSEMALTIASVALGRPAPRINPASKTFETRQQPAP